MGSYGITMFTTAPTAFTGTASQSAVLIHRDAVVPCLSIHGGVMAAILFILPKQSMPMTVLTVLMDGPLPASAGAPKKY